MQSEFDTSDHYRIPSRIELFIFLSIPLPCAESERSMGDGNDPLVPAWINALLFITGELIGHCNDQTFLQERPANEYLVSNHGSGHPHGSFPCLIIVNLDDHRLMPRFRLKHINPMVLKTSSMRQCVQRWETCERLSP